MVGAVLRMRWAVLLAAGLIFAACGVAPDDGGGPPDPVVPPPEELESEWTTYQGNASRTGYVPITVDPASFRERYVVVVEDGVQLTQPVTDGDGIFLSGVPGASRRHKLYALDASTGAPRWVHDFGPEQILHQPACYDGKVYVTRAYHNGGLYAFNAATGAMEFQALYSAQVDRFMGPAIRGGVVFGGGGSFSGGVFARDAKTGELRWNFRIELYDEFTPTLDESRVYVYTGAENPLEDPGLLRAIDRKTGLLVYQIEDPDFLNWVGCMGQAPVLGPLQDMFCVNWNYLGGRLIKFDLARQMIAWECWGDFKGQATLANRYVYAVNGYILEEREGTTGRRISGWMPPYQSAPSVNPYAPLIATNDVLFVGCRSIDETVYRTYAVDIATKQTLWSYDLGGEMALGREGILFIATKDGRLAAIDVK